MGIHRFDAGLFIRCGINSCLEEYKNFESFRSHMYRKHREAPVPDPTPLIGGSLNQEDSETNGEVEEAGGCESDEEEEQTTCGDDPKRLAALFLPQ